MKRIFHKICRNNIQSTGERNSEVASHPVSLPLVSFPVLVAGEEQTSVQSLSCANFQQHSYSVQHHPPERTTTLSLLPPLRPPPSPPPSYSVQCPSSAFLGRHRESITSSSSDESNDENDARLTGVENTYCPDLLHSCSLVIPSEINHEIENPTRTQNSSSEAEYEEIDDLCNQLSGVPCNIFASQASELYNQRAGCEKEFTEKAMGQNLSLRRPRISLTWVLREQQQSNGTTSTEVKNSNERKKFKPKNNDKKLFSEKYVSSHNLQEYQNKREPYKDILLVANPQKPQPDTHKTDIQTRRRNDYRSNQERSYGVGEINVQECESRLHESHEELKSLKGTYSEPSLITTSECGNQRRHRHRKRRDRNRIQKFGYEIRNVDEFLSKCSLASPGNIPVVLSSSSTLYQTKSGGYQVGIPLPLGMVVNAVFKNQNWLYVQTPHAEEGYVGYSSCLPLGILPPAIRSASTSKPPPCWETNGDVFPKPCGNMTDSEKEIRLRGGTRSDGARTPKPRRVITKNCGEHHVDKLYLRAASQPKLTEKSFAQLRPTIKYKHHEPLPAHTVTHDDYFLLQQKGRSNSQHHGNSCQKAPLLRQTLVAITNDYVTDTVAVRKGDIVTLLECKESKEKRQWFYIKTREGAEGFIPAEVAGHGFL